MTKESRPDPDSLLRRLQEEEQEQDRSKGRLKIFLGSAAGVGKTYQMLEEAQSLKRNGVDVAVAIIETHGRQETEDLVEGLEIIPRLQLEHGGIMLPEMDLDAVLARHPAVALVDELAHTNGPGSRHAKRYQDVEELLDAGINVYTTLNIQHIESLNDIVYQITRIKVSETLPDKVLDLADEIEVVDLPPEELLQRFKEGKVYVPPKAEQALKRFFRKGNLLGLRELALRYAAHRVDEDMRSYMERQGILGPWPAGSRLLVCVSTSSLSERLVRIGQRMAADLDAEWFAVYVESPQERLYAKSSQDQLARNLSLAEQLGAKVQVLRGRNIAEEILSFARTHNVTLIVVGLPRHSLRSRLLRGEVVSRITSHSGQIHVLVIGSTESDEKKQESAANPETLGLSMFYVSLLSVAGTTVFCWIFHQWLGLINTAMMLLLPVVYSGMTWGRRAGLAASLMAVMALDFFFVPPRLSLAVADLLYLPMFLVFIVVGIVTSFLADMVRWQGENARQRERFVSALYAFSRDLMETANLEELLRYAGKEIAQAFECEVLILMPDETGQLRVRAQVGEHAIFDERKLGVATWVYQHGQQAGHGTDTLSSATFSYLPLITKEATIGVLGVGLGRADQLVLPERRRLLEAFANILALTLSRSTNSLSKKEQSK